MLYQPYRLKDITFRNRIVMSPMCQYSASTDGTANSWHLLHYGSRAIGGVGLIMLEATAVEARGRISEHDLGIYEEDHVEGLAQIVDVCHEYGAAVGIQIAHAGRKACDQNLVAPSEVPVSPDKPIPQALTVDEISAVISRWRDAARRAHEAGFDVLEIHGAHGYLIHEFLSPLSNRRTDQYGGDLDNRMRFLLEVVENVKEVWPDNRPLLVRLSAVDYIDGGLTIDDTVQIAQTLKAHGVDMIDVSSGGLLPAPIRSAPGYQVRYAEEVKNRAQIPTIAVGLVSDVDLAEEIVFNERADLVALGRELLRNPYWALNNSPDKDRDWPRQYQRAIPTVK